MRVKKLIKETMILMSRENLLQWIWKIMISLIEEILDMPVESDLISGSEKSTVSEDKSVNVDNFSMNPVKTITIKKKESYKEIPLEIKIQQYADDLYEQHGYGTEYKKSIFIVELAEKFPGLEDYERFYDNAKKLHDLSV